MRNTKDQVRDAVKEYLGFLTHAHSFTVLENDPDDEDFIFLATSDTFDVRLEKYRREIYAYVRKHGHPTDEINLFTLLQYLHRNEADRPSSNYFPQLKSLDESLRMQVQWIADAISAHWSEIEQFFKNMEPDKIMAQINSHVMAQAPELFVRHQ